MRRVIVSVGAVLVICLLSGCGDSYESLHKQKVKTATEAADVLESIKDQASADAAKPKLKILGDRWRDLKKREEALPAPGSEQADKLKKLREDELTGPVLRSVKEGARVFLVPGGPAAMKELGEIKQ